jgi:hypothetical protein
MTPKGKALELYESFTPHWQSVNEPLIHNEVRRCALQCVDKIIEALDAFGYTRTMYDDFETGQCITSNDADPCDYWKKVKSEIKLL